MPGPVSDSYDPEFGTGSNANDVTEAIRLLIPKVSRRCLANAPLKDIVRVAQGQEGKSIAASFSEKEWRLIRFSLNRALESI